MADALIIIPLFNEAATLEGVLTGVRRAAPAADVLVVDDGSTDDPGAVLRRHPEVQVVRHDTNQGYGRSLITGFAQAVRGGGYGVAVTIDGDEQHEPLRIPQFLEAAARADIVSGSRYLDPTVPGDPPPPDRAQLNREFTERIRAITGYAITDAWCGFKAYRLHVLRKLRLTEPSYGMPLQVWVQAAYHRCSIIELPVARIYKNPRRRFWGGLDDPQTRRTYYLRVLEAEVATWLPERLDLLKAKR